MPVWTLAAGKVNKRESRLSCPLLAPYSVTSAPAPATQMLSNRISVSVSSGNIGVIVLPDQVAISTAHEAFEAGHLKDERKAAQVAKLALALVEFTAKLKR